MNEEAVLVELMNEGSFSGRSVARLDMQTRRAYVNRRASMKSQFKKPISASTINKELVTFGTMWRWAARCRMVEGTFVISQRSDQFVVFQERHQFLNRTATLDQLANRPQAKVAMTPRDLTPLLDLVATMPIRQRQQSLQNAGARAGNRR